MTQKVWVIKTIAGQQFKAAHALTRLSNTYNIPIHKFIENDVTVKQLEYGEMAAIAATYKERNRTRITIWKLVNSQKWFYITYPCEAIFIVHYGIIPQ